MGNFDRGNRRSGGGRGFGGQRPSGRDGGRAQMHKATCSDCGGSCEVPFRPTGSKPVYCSNCFSNQDGGSRGGRDDRGGRSGGYDKGRHRDRDREMFDVVCDKCGKNCQVPFKPKSNKSLFCDDCFGKDKGRSGGGSSDELMNQIKILNEKIDNLTEILSSKSAKEKTAETEEKKEKVKAPKKEAKKVAKKTVKKVAKKVVKAKKEKVVKKAVKKVAKKKK